MQKEDLFDAHNFDIEIDVDTALIGKNFSAFSHISIWILRQTLGSKNLLDGANPRVCVGGGGGGRGGK